VRERIGQLPLHATLDLLCPLGSGLPARREWRQLLLVAEGVAVGPLLAVAEAALAADQSVTLLSVTPPNQSPYPSDALPVSIEYQGAPRGGAGGIGQDM
jgi:NAD(P)H-flavin reductase